MDLGELSATSRIWIGKLALNDFRSYRAATLRAGSGPVVLTGPNGAGKTNCLEAISLLTAGRGLRALSFSDHIRNGAPGGWTVAAKLFLGDEELQIGTGIQVAPDGGPGPRSSRTVKIDNAMAKGSGALAKVRMLWLTPAMDGLFSGPASERRRFIDRLALSLDPAFAPLSTSFERAMTQRNKALESLASPRVLAALEAQMAEAGARIAAHRHLAINLLRSEIEAELARAGDSVFPWADISLSGHLESQIGSIGHSDIGAAYQELLARSRERDRAAGRTLVGPHRSDLSVGHGPKAMPAKMCSTGEQKALLVGLVLAQARLIKKACGGMAPLILLDEIAAHLDGDRRRALFSSIAALKAQVWMTGTDMEIFEPLRDIAPVQFFLVLNGSFNLLTDAESASRH